MFNKLCAFIKDIRIEIISIILIAVILMWDFLDLFSYMSGYFTSERLNGIATFFSITIGVYITVITVLATAEMGISAEMLRRQLDKRLINIMMMGIVEDFIAVSLAVFVPLNVISVKLLVLSIIMAGISFVKFIRLLFIIFKVNMEQMVKKLDEDERNQAELLTNISEITKMCRESMNKQ